MMLKVICDELEDLRIFQKACDACFDLLNLSGEAEVYLGITSDEEMHQINFRTRSIDKTTDVLSFPMLDKIMPFNISNYPYDFLSDKNAVSIGDILINSDAVKRQSEEFNTKDREIVYLFTHGLLHLMGYDHMQQNEKTLMREKEEQILLRIGVSI